MRTVIEARSPLLGAATPLRSIATGFLIVIIGIACLGWVTGGFRAILLETLRRLELAEEHPVLPNVQVQDQLGNLLDIGHLRERTLVVTFIYTRCMTLCSVTGTELEWLQRQMQRTGHPDAQLLSVSFDGRDDLSALQDYAQRNRAQWPGWRIVRIPDPIARQEFFRQLGVIIIPDGFGGYAHNAALYLIDPDGRVHSVFDIDGAPLLLTELQLRQ